MSAETPSECAELRPHLAGFLTEALAHEDNAFIRLVAARELSRRRAELAASEDATATIKAIRQASTADHPDKSKFKLAEWNNSEEEADLDSEIQAACAAALLGCEVAEADRAMLLHKVVEHDEVEVVRQAIARWSSVQALEALQSALSREPAIAVAAAKAIGACGPAAAAARAALERAQGSKHAELAAAAQAALQQIDDR